MRDIKPVQKLDGCRYLTNPSRHLNKTIPKAFSHLFKGLLAGFFLWATAIEPWYKPDKLAHLGISDQNPGFAGEQVYA